VNDCNGGPVGPETEDSAPVEENTPPARQQLPPLSASRRRIVREAPHVLVAFTLGLGAGFVALGRSRRAGVGRPATDPVAIAGEVNPAGGYELPESLADVGPQLLAAGAIDEAGFLGVYERAGRPLTAEQKQVLRRGSSDLIVIDGKNAYFLLNLLWALGLANDNPLLKQGPLMQNSNGQTGRYASTGGWTLATRPVTELYAGTSIIELTDGQQARLEEVASAAYRPCRNNPTSLPDCNHGMALLGLLELMAARGASVEAMFTAAKEVNAFWFPQQAYELATYIRYTTGVSYAKLDGRQAVGRQYFSADGSQTVRQYLATNGLLQKSPNSGGGCGV